MTGHEIRLKRHNAGLTGSMVCKLAGMTRSRFSDIEREYVSPRDGELQRILAALEKLTRTKQRLAETAAACGWPVTL